MTLKFSKTPTKPVGNKYEGITYECGASGYRLDCAGLVCRRCKDAKIVKMSKSRMLKEIESELERFYKSDDYNILAETTLENIDHIIMFGKGVSRGKHNTTHK